MSITTKSIKCPECGANLQFGSNQEKGFCSYCGAQIVVTNENEYIIHHIDEADIKKAETDRIIQLKKIEAEERKITEDKKMLIFKVKLSIALAIVGAILMLIGFGGAALSKDPNSPLYILGGTGGFPMLGILYLWLFHAPREKNDGKISIPDSISGYIKMDYSAAERMLKSAGFNNIQTIPLNDLTTGLLKKPDMVESITVNGNKISCGGDRFFPDAQIFIAYHSKAK